MTTPIFSKTSLRALRAVAFLFVPAMLVTACGGGPQAALPFAPSAIPSSSTALEAADESNATASADTAGTLGKGSDKGKDGEKGDSDKGGNDKDKKKDGSATTGTDATVVEIKGTVSSVTNTCPAKTFVVGLDKTVMTATTTTYKHGNCEKLLKDAVVVVHATTDANGRLVAKDVEFTDGDMAEDDDEDSDDEDSDDEDSDGNPHNGTGPFEGTVSSFRGVCPLVTFNLKGMTIVATAATTYEGVPEAACVMLRPSVKVVVTRGTGSVGRVVMAATITITRMPGRGHGPDTDDEDDSDAPATGTPTPTPTTPTK
jgi:hypothetical protein